MHVPHPGWLDDGALPRQRLVDELVAAGAIRSEGVRAAFTATPREVFLAGHALWHGVPAVYHNEVLVTLTDACGVALSSSSQPQLMAAMLERLTVVPGMRVLEVGTGTGYNAALLSHLVGAGGRVVSVELDSGLSRAARDALVLSGHDVEVVTGDGAAGHAAGAPYDRIMVTASARTVAAAWVDQLVEGGLLEVPLRFNGDESQVVATFRRAGGRLVSEGALSGRFMPLRGDPSLDQHPSPMSVLIEPRTDVAAARLAGASVSALGAADRELLAAALGTPRIRPLGITAPPWDLVMFVSLEVPAGQLVSRWPEISVGVLTREGGLALVEGRRTDGQVPRPLHLVSYGAPEAEERLVTTVDRWLELGHPGVDDLVMHVQPDGQVVTAWRQVSSPSH